MLMDEPFGAIDPINRERLQNEFLRLQAEIRKTILFVTHDIDEAIKMGDRIAVLREGGTLAQYATPAELLMAPADDFVEDFVGADRALKRLALMRVADIDLWEAPLAFVGQATAEVRAKLEGAEVPHALVVDSERRPLGWLSERDLTARDRPARPDTSPDPLLDLDDVMRDALSDLLQAETHYAPVVDAQGRIAGVLSVEIISEFLTSPRRWSRSTRPPSGRWRPKPVAASSPSAAARPGRRELLQASRTRPGAASPRTALLLRLGVRQHRPLRTPRRSSTWSWSWSRSRRGSRSPSRWP